MRASRFLPLLIALLALGGCGSDHSRIPPAPSSLPGQAHGHPCSPSDYFMQCAANAPQPPALRLGAPLPSATAAFGIDFAWGGPSGSFARARGAHFAVSYLSGSSKDWSYGLAHTYPTSGEGIGFVWETSASRSLGGCAAGAADARAGAAEEARLGFAGAPEFFASDFDTTGFSAHGSVGEYYRCARLAVGTRAGAYGGLRTIQIAQANGYPDSRLWQTIAWSRGYWTSACLRQTSINDRWFGYSVDYDYAVCGDYGQYRPPAPPPRLRCFTTRGYGYSSSTCRKVRSQVASDERAAASSQRAYHARRCDQLQAWERYFSRPRPHVSASQARRALAAAKLEYSRRSCDVFNGRVSYFSALIAQARKRY